MRINKLIIVAISLMCLIPSVNAKKAYYYYNGVRISLTLSDDSVAIYTCEDIKNGVPSYASRTISSRNKSAIEDESVTSIEYIIKGDKARAIEMSNRFYVQLFDSVSDLPVLQSIAKETHAIISGPIPYMSDWYELVVHNSIINNSLEMANYFYETGLFKNIDPGFIFHFTSSSSCVTDSHFSYQWGLPSIKACEAWEITKGSSNVKIAIIDKGILRDHTEFVYNNFIDEYDCNTQTSVGYRVYDEHGTWVGGVITSDHNHAEVAGMAPNCKIIPISYGVTDTNVVATNLASGFAWAVAHGADVINCSWGDHHQYTWLHSTLLETAIQNALLYGRNGKGCVVVFAAGNVNSFELDYPAYVFPDIITVGAMREDSTRLDNASISSSYGYKLDVVAPGNNIYTTNIPWDDDQYVTVAGTSLAAPYVSGIAGLMLSANPLLIQKEIVNIIESTAVKVGDGINYFYNTTQGRLNGRWDFEMGYGLVDAYAATLTAMNTNIRGPEQMCDTAKYYLIRPSQPGETVLWSIDNSQILYPTYSIVGSNNQDTVIIACNDETIPHRDRLIPPTGHTKYLHATITNSDTTITYSKVLRHTVSEVPTISASNSNIGWLPRTQRTFTVSNCTAVPDSALKWTVRRIIPPRHPNYSPTVVTNYYYGRTLTYSAPTVPLTRVDTLDISVSNLAGECGVANSNTLRFILLPSLPLLNTYVEGELLNISITEENDNRQQVLAQLNDDSCYTLELWHSIYGCMRAQVVSGATERMSVSGLPSGIYVLLLKENGNIIAETKVQIP